MPKSDNRPDSYRDNKSRSSGSKSNYKSDRKSSDSKKTYGSDKPRFDKKEGEGSKKRFDKPFRKREEGDDKKPFRKKFGEDKGFGEKRSYGDKDKPFRKRSDDGEKKPFRKKFGEDKGFGGKRSYSDKDKPFRKRSDDGEKKPVRKKFGEDKGFGEKRSYSDKDKPFRKRSDDGEKKPFRKKFGEDKGFGEKRSYGDKDKPFRKRSDDGEKKPFRKKFGDDKGFVGKEGHDSKKRYGKDSDGRRDDSRTFSKKHDDKKHRKFKPHGKKHESKNIDDFLPNPDGLTRLNKYLSNAGICSRREADDLIKAGAVSVNGKVITEMGFKVGPDDKISYGGETLRHQKKVYLMLNKPKDYITTTDDPQERRTVMHLIAGACKERVYPVGRLDRNTTGILLFTNDGELTTKLMHPKFGIKKVYQVNLDKNLKGEDFQQLEEGIELEDGFIKPDAISYINGNKKEIGIEIHSGRNRIVRRIFEHLGYEVVKLDRVVFAGLTKKDLPRAKWRFLTDKEVGFLKMIG